MSFFLSCLKAKRKKSLDNNYSSSNEQLPRAKTMIKQPVQSSNFHTSKISHQKQLKRSKSSIQHSIIRNQGYSQITNLVTGLNMYLTDEELNFTMDYHDGISHNFAINTFNYQVKNDTPGFLYYQNVGFKGFQQKQANQPKKSKQKQKSLKKQGLDWQDKINEIPTNF